MGLDMGTSLQANVQGRQLFKVRSLCHLEEAGQREPVPIKVGCTAVRKEPVWPSQAPQEGHPGHPCALPR